MSGVQGSVCFLVLLNPLILFGLTLGMLIIVLWGRGNWLSLPPGSGVGMAFS